MKIVLYCTALLLFIVSAGVLGFAPITRENLDLIVSLAEAGTVTLCVASVVDFAKYLLRMSQ